MSEASESTYRRFSGVFEGIVKEGERRWAEFNFTGCEINPVSIESTYFSDTDIEKWSKFKTKVSALLQVGVRDEVELKPLDLKVVK